MMYRLVPSIKLFQFAVILVYTVFSVVQLQLTNYHETLIIPNHVRRLRHQEAEPVNFTMDVVSIGSKTRSHYLHGQLETWASPDAIRTFFAVTELDDANPMCTSDMDSSKAYVESCHDNPKFSQEARTFVDDNFGLTEGDLPDESIKRVLPGWFCAQRRTLQGLASYLNDLDPAMIPDYLVLVDDDTYFDTQAFKHHIQGSDPDLARVYAGCLFEENSDKSISWEFPYGGFGVVFSRGAIRQMMTPLYCEASKRNGFEASACKALEENRIDEKRFFKRGMSAVELLSNYSAYSEPMCFHSDWMVGFMIKYYLSVVPPQVLESNATTIHPILTWPYQCGNHTLSATCDPLSGDGRSMFCHRQGPEQLLAYQEKADKLHAGHPRNNSAIQDALEKLKVKLNPTEATVWLDKLKQDIVGRTPMTEPMGHYWQSAESWFTARQVLPPSDETDALAQIMGHLRTGRILRASSISSSGTQLKLLLQFEGGQKAIFKPKRLDPGWDRPNSEIAAFHLSRLLDFRRAPITVGRRLNVAEELIAVADPELLATFVSNSTVNNCFYGTCRFCSVKKLVCPEEGGYLEGAIILMLPEHLNDGSDLVLKEKYNPYPPYLNNDYDQERRDASKDKDYCDRVVKHELPLEPRLLDIVETSVIDFLIQNTDRHHYEFVVNEKDDGAVLLLDQGKGFDPTTSDQDDLYLLQPLVQCCVLRNTVYAHLRSISHWDVSFSSVLRELTDVEPTSPVLSEDQLVALDRRMKIVQRAISTCVAERGPVEVIQGYHSQVDTN